MNRIPEFFPRKWEMIGCEQGTRLNEIQLNEHPSGRQSRFLNPDCKLVPPPRGPWNIIAIVVLIVGSYKFIIYNYILSVNLSFNYKLLF